MSLSNQTFAEHKKRDRRISPQLFFMTIALVAVVGFVAGTRSDDIIGIVGPRIGLKVASGTIDTSKLQDVYRQLKANYDGTLDTQALIDGASRGLVAAAGDQYTVYMDAKEAAEFDKDLSGNIGGGIGAEIGLRNGAPTIIRALPDNPAEKAGLQAGDIILAVNDESAASWTADQVAAKVRGDVGTTIKLTVRRGSETKEFTITRAVVNNPSVSSRIDNGVGILTISRFDEQTGLQAQAAAENFKAQGVKGVVLDLRGNGGGYLTEAQKVASIWLNDKLVVSERTGGAVTDEIRSDSNPTLGGVPTVVLVDAGSASASEIVAGALQDNKAATLVGEKTFGKGTVQKILDMGAGTKLKVTVARWYTPNGKNITKEGIEPDQKVDLTQANLDAGQDPQLDAAQAKLGL